jgi:uncharacterized membrane protein/3-hydroxymyristoyl/3-hydroxydecanoyl-(acyl carrier protein) dehydratase
MRLRRYGSIVLLAACVAAALALRRFVFLAWYPVLMSVATAGGFALSLFGRESLCYTLAKRIPPHVLPPGAVEYCRRYTQVWAAWLFVNALIAVATIYAPGPKWRLERAGFDVPLAWAAWNCCLSYCATGLIILTECAVRRRRFAAVFHTSGSTAEPKRIVKTFRSLAREVAHHLAALRRRGVLPRAGAGGGPLFLCTIEPGHMYGMLWRVLLPAAAECRVDPEVILAPETLLEKMRSAERVFLVTTPSFLDRFCEYAGQYEVPRNCVEVVTSGALLSAKTSAEAKRVFGVAPLEIFGSTETGGVAWRRQDGVNAPGGFDWQVLAPVKVKSGADGRLAVSSPFSCSRWFEMGDGAEISPDGHSFRLKGRMDRMAKIAEQRVSLPEMEAKMAALPGVKEAALSVLDGRHGPSLGAVVALDMKAVDVSCGKRALALDFRRRLLPLFPKGAVPKRYRFVMELPRNAQGKVLASRVKEILESDFVEPFVFEVHGSGAQWTAEMFFDGHARYFKGHFPGIPVLPGVVQLGMARHFAEVFLRRPVVLRAVKKIKFTHVITPSTKVRLALEKTSESEIAYKYTKGEQVCSSGVMCF